MGARMSLAMLHQQQGKHDEALKALSQGNTVELQWIEHRDQN